MTSSSPTPVVLQRSAPPPSEAEAATILASQRSRTWTSMQQSLVNNKSKDLNRVWHSTGTNVRIYSYQQNFYKWMSKWICVNNFTLGNVCINICREILWIFEYIWSNIWIVFTLKHTHIFIQTNLKWTNLRMYLYHWYKWYTLNVQLLFVTNIFKYIDHTLDLKMFLLALNITFAKKKYVKIVLLKVLMKLT